MVTTATTCHIASEPAPRMRLVTTVIIEVPITGVGTVRKVNMALGAFILDDAPLTDRTGSGNLVSRRMVTTPMGIQRHIASDGGVIGHITGAAVRIRKPAVKTVI